MRARYVVVVALALASVALLATAISAAAFPADATRTGQPCTTCHTSATGGALTATGRAYQASGRQWPVPSAAPAPAAPAAPTARPAIRPTGAVQMPGPQAGPGGANVLMSSRASAAPTLDGNAGDQAWAAAQPLSLRLSGGLNFPGGSSEVTMKSVYTGDTVYFLAEWTDPTESVRRQPYQKQPDGSWTQLRSGASGDENEFYEDKFALIWNIDDSIQGFNTQGCAVTCHPGEGKPYGNKYTNSPGERGDIWHLKGVRTGYIGQIDDQYLDSTRYDAQSAPEAGRKSDANTGGGYRNNPLENGVPAFGLPGNRPAPPYFIREEEKVAFNNSAYQPGAEVPSIMVSLFQGDRGDLPAGYRYSNGKYTLEWSRKLVTGSERDVQFQDLSKGYYFGVAAFENAQVRHAYQAGVNQLRFEGAAAAPAAARPGAATQPSGAVQMPRALPATGEGPAPIYPAGLALVGLALLGVGISFSRAAHR